MSEESVMRSLNTDAGRARHITSPGKVRRRRRGAAGGGGEGGREAERFNESDGKGFLDSERISNRAVPVRRAVRFPRYERAFQLA